MTKTQIIEGYLIQKMRNRLTSLLKRIQKLSGGQMFTVAGQATVANDLSKILLKPFRGSVMYEFSIGQYNILLVVIIPGKQEYPRIILTTCLNKQVISIRQREIEYERTQEFTYNFQDLQVIFKQIMSGLGNYDLYHDYDYPGEARVHSLYSILLQERSEKEKKELPAWGSEFIRHARKLVAAGGPESLDKIIRKEIARLQPLLIAEAVPLLRADGRKLMAAAEATKIALSPRAKSKKTK
ncbi:MAG: hypothetical protein WC467_02230 [Patescibacteria group bacterium]